VYKKNSIAFAKICSGNSHRTKHV